MFMQRQIGSGIFGCDGYAATRQLDCQPPTFLHWHGVVCAARLLSKLKWGRAWGECVVT